jgi:hypothetical protein
VCMCTCVHEDLYDCGAARVQLKETAVQEVCMYVCVYMYVYTRMYMRILRQRGC